MLHLYIVDSEPFRSADIIFKQASSDCDRECYHREMSRANFCLCPLGWTPWTLRFYQAVMTRCIPVVVANDIEFPWENEIDYSRFAIKVPEAKVWPRFWGFPVSFLHIRLKLFR